MKHFVYTFFDENAKINTSYLQAYALSEAKNALLKQRVTLVDIKECEPQEDETAQEKDVTAKARPKLQKQKKTFFQKEKILALMSKANFMPSKRLNYDQFIIFLRELTVLLTAGMTVIRSLEILSEQTQDKVLKEAVRKVSVDVLKGDSLYAAFYKEGVFPKIFVNLVHAGEVSGELPKILMDLADYYEKERELKKRAYAALTYPITVLVVSILGVIFLASYIFPSFINIYASLKIELPLPTKIIVFIVECFRNKFFMLFLLAAVFLIFAALKNYIKTPQGRYQVDSIVVYLPVVGNILRKIALSRFARTLGTLYEEGLSMNRSLEITIQIINNSYYETQIKDITKKITVAGEPLSEALEEKNFIFPQMFISLVNVGEETGRVGVMLRKISLYFDEEVYYILDNMVNIIEPFIVIFVGGAVLFIMLSLFMPLYNLISQFGLG